MNLMSAAFLGLNALLFGGSGYEGFVPPAEMNGTIEALARIRWDESTLSRESSVTFVSGQSEGPARLQIINRVQYFEGKDRDVWVMRQGVEGRAPRMDQRNLLAIVVDHRSRPGTAYYFEYGPGDVVLGKPPKPVPYTAACYSCHTSGPRVIRPRRSSLVPDLSASDRALIAKWNERISSYREVKTFRPTQFPKEGYTSIDYPGVVANRPLLHRACVECHSPGSGIRAPLVRQAGDSVVALIHHMPDAQGYWIQAERGSQAYMPHDGIQLSDREKHCLADWIGNEKSLSPAPGCSADGEAL